MKEQKGFRVSLSNGDVFNAMKSDFDQMVRKALNTMISKDSEEAEITVKVKISLENGLAPDIEQHAYEAQRETIVPKFSHKVSYVVNYKDEKSGSTGGKEYELLWDKDQGDFFMRPIKDAASSEQYSLFESESSDDDEEDTGLENVTYISEHFDPQPYESGEDTDGDGVCEIVQKCGCCCKVCEVTEGCTGLCKIIDGCTRTVGSPANMILGESVKLPNDSDADLLQPLDQDAGNDSDEYGYEAPEEEVTGDA